MLKMVFVKRTIEYLYYLNNFVNWFKRNKKKTGERCDERKHPQNVINCKEKIQ